MQKIGFLFLIGWCFFLMSCSSAPGSGSKKNGNPNNPNDASASISEIPDMKMKNVPDSLAANSDMKMKMEMKSMPHRRLTRTPGEITNFVASALPDVKAQGWIDMHNSLKNTVILDCINYLKSFAAANSVPYDTDVKMGPYVIGGMPVIQSVVNVHQADSNTLEIYWTVQLTITELSANAEFPCFIKVMKDNNGKATAELVADVAFSASTEDGVVSIKERYYSYYSEVSNSTMSCGFSKQDVGGFPLYESAVIDQIAPYPSGGMVLKTYDTFIDGMYGSASSNFSIAWGDDLKGGLISSYDYTSGDQTNSSINTEYYNQDGSLVFQSWGNRQLQDTSWMDYYTMNGTNLANLGFAGAPDSFAIICSYPNYTISNVDTGVTAPISSSTYNFYFQQSSSWQSGDSIYWCIDYQQVNGVYVETFIKGYSIPYSHNFFSKDYYVQNSWPMKYLTLQPAYSNYVITRQENNTYSYTYTNVWTNIDGSIATNIDNWDWTDYQWWLDYAHNNTLNSNDIRLQNIQAYDVYIWNGTTMDKQKGLFVFGSEPTPRYFDFTESNIITGIDTRISNIYAEQQHFDLTAFTNSLPVMPLTNQFPKLQ